MASLPAARASHHRMLTPPGDPVGPRSTCPGLRNRGSIPAINGGREQAGSPVDRHGHVLVKVPPAVIASVLRDVPA